MELDYAFFAKAVELNPDGVFSVFGGGFSGLEAAEFPLTVPTLALVAKVDLAPDEVEARAFRCHIEVVPPPGVDLPVRADIPLTATTPRHPGRTASLTFALNIVGLALPGPGEYRFVVSVDGREVGAATLYADHRPPQQEVPT